MFGKVPSYSIRQIYKRRRLFYGRRQQPGSLPQRWEPRPLRLFLEDISIIASLFNCEPRNTQAEVMSPSLVAEYHLFARGCMENASWLEVLFSYFAAEMQQRSWSSLSFFFFFFYSNYLEHDSRFKIQAANISARSSRLQTENSLLIIQAPVHQNVQLEVVEKKNMRAFHNERLSHSSDPIATSEDTWKRSPDYAPSGCIFWLMKSFCQSVCEEEHG